ncbi:MAG: cytochrome C [Gammaproteobacteria bacterium]|nr:cytochrome C [Gammaproteobacteria bacterium]
MKAYHLILTILFVLTISSAFAETEIRSGKDIYDMACAGCHATGVLEAPKLGSKTDWDKREKQGFEVLMIHALKGFKNMPAKGGNPTIKDQEIENAIKYQLAQSGFDQYKEKSGSTENNKTAPAKKTADTRPKIIPEAIPETKNIAKIKQPKKTRTHSVNRFNRLMKPAAEWNLSPAKDGIHDPENEGTLLLQPPKQAFESLSNAKSGNRVDWVKSLQNKEISPRYDRLSDDSKPVVMDLNIVREVKGSMPDVVYPHKQHTEWLDCSNCHPAIFIPQKGANQISMASILLGQQCGVCHGKVAFPVSECRKCHSQKKALKTGNGK